QSGTIRIINQEKVKMDDSIDDPYCFSIMRKLKFLRMSNLKTLWEESLVFLNLRSIDLSFSKELIKIPDLTSTPKLVKLILEGCTNLKDLGRSNIEIKALVTLLLFGCSNLEYILEFGQNMKCLENLYLDGANIKKLPESLEELHSLRKLDAIPDFIGLLHRLISLDLSGNDFVHLPASISLPFNLKMLCLNNRKRLQSLPKLLILRAKYWMTPEAAFEIVGAGSEIPSRFTMRKSDETFSLDGPWVGLAICAVISSRHIDANTETKYVVTTHIHDGETRSKISVPVHLVPRLENQLVFYWTIADDLQRMVMPSKRNWFHVVSHMICSYLYDLHI
ncbi:NB-ARC domains-containing protein, partial [Tanacetum coccineum]